MSDEHTVTLQSSMQFLPARLPLIVLQSVKGQLPAYREIMVSAVCLCADNRIILSYSEGWYGPTNKMFYRNLTLPFILCGLRF